jgi:mRNA-degrading endonuclease toxin of MazEF toxin-antitoxin module
MACPSSWATRVAKITHRKAAHEEVELPTTSHGLGVTSNLLVTSIKLMAKKTSQHGIAS